MLIIVIRRMEEMVRYVVGCFGVIFIIVLDKLADDVNEP